MTTETWLNSATKILSEAGIGTARLDCLVLMEDCLGKGRAGILAHPDRSLTTGQLKNLNRQIEQRRSHLPLAFIRGKTEFYGREFLLTQNVLEPRPESEAMIDLVKSLKLLPKARVIDIGTGSGAIGITLALELPSIRVTLTEIDPRAMAIAKKNAQIYGVGVDYAMGDLLQALGKHLPLITAVCANLPYVPDHYQLNNAAMHEPRIAIFGGPDGLDLYRQLFKQLAACDQPPRFVLTESLPFQHETLSQIAKGSGYKLQRTEDFVQLFVT